MIRALDWESGSLGSWRSFASDSSYMTLCKSLLFLV